MYDEEDEVGTSEKEAKQFVNDHRQAMIHTTGTFLLSLRRSIYPRALQLQWCQPISILVSRSEPDIA
jgi:hypothetical protein